MVEWNLLEFGVFKAPCKPVGVGGRCIPCSLLCPGICCPWSLIQGWSTLGSREAVAAQRGAWCRVRKLPEVPAGLPEPCLQQEMGRGRGLSSAVLPGEGTGPSAPCSILAGSQAGCVSMGGHCRDSALSRLLQLLQCSDKPQHPICLQLLEPLPPKITGLGSMPRLCVCGIGLGVWDQVLWQLIILIF